MRWTGRWTHTQNTDEWSTKTVSLLLSFIVIISCSLVWPSSPVALCVCVNSVCSIKSRFSIWPLPCVCMQVSCALRRMNTGGVRGRYDEDLAFGSQLLLITVRWISRDLAGPQSQTHHQVSTAHHQERKEVNQDCYTHVVPLWERWDGLMGIRERK